MSIGIYLQLLTKKEEAQQHVIWELLQTEVEYIKSLKVLTNVSLSS